MLDLSRGAASTALLARVDGTGVFNRVATLRSASEIAGVIDRGDALLVLSIPGDFEARLAGRPERAAADDSGRAQFDHRRAPPRAMSARSLPRTTGPLGGAPPIAVERRAWYNPNLESRWNLMPALIAALSMLQTLLLSALSVAREREQGTFDQLLVTPFTPMQILIGKALPSILVGLVQSTIIFLIIRFWFQIPMSGSVWLLYLGLFTFTGAAVGIGLSISALSVSMQQAMLYTFLLIMPLMLLSGLMSPVSNMPRVLQLLTYANPLRFGMDLVRRVYLEGAGLREVAFDFVPMLAVAGITLPLAAWLFRNRLA